MARLLVFALVASSCVMPAAIAGDFEWTVETELVNGKERTFHYARVTPELYDQLLKTGLEVTEGTATTDPAIKTGGPGAKVLKLGNKLYDFDGSNGFAESDGKKIWVLRFIPHRPKTFTGKWKTNWVDLNLAQNGDKVTGNYTFKGIKSTITGTVKDGVLIGKYYQPGFPDERYTEGPIKFTLSSEGNSFKGEWGNKEGKIEGEWNGERIVEEE